MNIARTIVILAGTCLGVLFKRIGIKAIPGRAAQRI